MVGERDHNIDHTNNRKLREICFLQVFWLWNQYWCALLWSHTVHHLCYAYVKSPRLEYGSHNMTQAWPRTTKSWGGIPGRGCDQFQVVPVVHCADSHGLVLEHPSGWKLVYSGDCRPSDALIQAGEEQNGEQYRGETKKKERKKEQAGVIHWLFSADVSCRKDGKDGCRANEC